MQLLLFDLLAELKDFPSYQFAGLSSLMLPFLSTKLADQSLLLNDWQLIQRLGGSGFFYRLKGRWPDLQQEVLRLKEERVKIETEKDVKVIKEIREELRKGRVAEESKIEESMEKLDV